MVPFDPRRLQLNRGGRIRERTIEVILLEARP
jgi:hypothetical protein